VLGLVVLSGPGWLGTAAATAVSLGVPNAPPGTYHPPVDAPVRDPFRPPPGPFGPGNRGIEYATTPGTRVLAIGPGVVVFAGPIAGERYVTVRHLDGLRSSYSYLATIAVREGDVVSERTVVGLAGTRLHLGVRRGDEYIDPAGLWGRPYGPMRPVLVPLDGGPTPAARGAPAPGPGGARAPRAEPLVSIARRAIGRVAQVTGGMLRW
jgi:murein DD-endopeptidase MepM/ murein hydrolase activator NlpD